jgi:accessory colonization factor AcfC
MTQEWDFLDPELALPELGVQLMLSQMMKYNSEVIFMLFHTLQIYQNIINEHHDKLSNSDIKTEFMRYMKCASTFINPNDITRYS